MSSKTFGDVPSIGFEEYHESIDSYDEQCEARVEYDELEEGNFYVMRTNPHGEDIDGIMTVRITEALSDHEKRAFERYDGGIVANIRFEDSGGNSYKYMLDNYYVEGHHTGLGRVSDIAKGARFYRLEAFE